MFCEDLEDRTRMKGGNYVERKFNLSQNNFNN